MINPVVHPKSPGTQKTPQILRLWLYIEIPLDGGGTKIFVCFTTGAMHSRFEKHVFLPGLYFIDEKMRLMFVIMMGIKPRHLLPITIISILYHD